MAAQTRKRKAPTTQPKPLGTRATRSPGGGSTSAKAGTDFAKPKSVARGKGRTAGASGSAAAGTDFAKPKSVARGGGRVDVSTKIIAEALTFDDVLLVPRQSSALPSDADTGTRLTRNIRLNIPLVSAPMDTVTESALAIALALEGGVGIIHKNLSAEAQAREVAKVKRSANGVITDPITLTPGDTVADARELMRRYNVSGFPVIEGDGKSGPGGGAQRGKGRAVGILTTRDLKFIEDDRTPVRDVMTSEKLVTAPAGTTLDQAARILNKNKVEKLLLVEGGRLAGLVTMRDIERLAQYPRANLDGRGRLRCGAAVGVHQYERVEALIGAGVDVIVVDTAHGHSENVLKTVREIKRRHKVDVIAGNIATGEAARDLIDAGADAVKVGIGPGSICTTRIVTGVGVPQVTAVFNAVAVAEKRGVPVIADGGIRQSGDIAKALAAGASSVMMGSLFAGLDESPGELVISRGRRYKSYRGMGSEGAMGAGSADRYGQADKLKAGDSRGSPNGRGERRGNGAAPKFVPEGVEGLAPYRGPLNEFVYQMVGGVRSAMGYLGCRTIDEMRREARFVRTTSAGMVESHPHDIVITKESPNYTSGRAGEAE